MNLDDMQKVWQSQDAADRPPVDFDALLKKVQLDRRLFQATIFRRDIVEVGLAAVLAIVFGMRAAQKGDWAMWLLAGSMIWVGGFMVLDRWRQKRNAKQRPQPPTLISSIEASLDEVSHQIWLLKNILYWYLLPPLVGLTLFFGRIAKEHAEDAFQFWVGFLVPTGICVLMYAGIYWFNQHAVRHNLRPRRDELESLRDQLLNSES